MEILPNIARRPKFPRLSEIHNKLEQQNYAIYQKEQQLIGLDQELDKSEGVTEQLKRIIR